jgi:predicted kinase
MALVVFGGLPGTGKTTIARALAIRLGATYLRIDIIEQSIRSAGVLAAEVGPAGYFVANALAASNLANGLSVVADCVNPVPESRDGWRGTASRAGAPLIEVEVVCSDRDEHRRRVEGRGTDIEGLVLPTWQSVLEREFAPWPEPHLLIDTASLTPEEAVALVKRTIDEIQGAT